jgi:choline dehydrogenase
VTAVNGKAEYDVIVVGGGAAGCVVAARLSEDGTRRVLLLEAGPDYRTEIPVDVRDGWRPTTSHDWGYIAEPDEAGVARALPRGKLLGGCSSTNATFALRGHPADYDAWARAGNHGWSFEEVLPFFVRLESDADFGGMPWHGDDGPLPIRRYGGHELTDVALAGLAALEKAGCGRVPDANAPGAVGVAATPMNTRDGERVSTAIAYLPAGRPWPNLTVRCGTEAAGLLVERGHVTGVRLANGGEIRAARVILCAGAYGTPALLMRSGIGPAGHLRQFGIPVVADLPGVGANLADHPAVSVDLGYDPPVRPAPVFQVAATLHSEDADGNGPPDLQCLVGGPFANRSCGSFFLGVALLKPWSRGTVRLRSADPSAAPRIDLGYFREPADLDRLAAGLGRVRESATAAAIAELSGGVELAPGRDVANGDPQGLREWIRRNAWTYHHPVGTCAMGPAPDSGAVVDASGEVHGVSGLSVADASVMPDIPSANTHIPTVMIAERIASLLVTQGQGLPGPNHAGSLTRLHRQENDRPGHATRRDQLHSHHRRRKG